MEYFSQNPALWWLGFAITLLIAELLTGTLLFLFLSAGASLLVLLTWGFDISGSTQAIVFAIAAVVLVVAWRKFRPNPGDKVEQRAGASGLNNRLAGFVGREAVLEESVSNGQGRIRLDDSYWNVRGEDLPAGSRVRIVAVEGMILRVQAL
ncbi:MAG: NfeD family protein [Moraxellaceae bacterium]